MKNLASQINLKQYNHFLNNKIYDQNYQSTVFYLILI